MKIKKTDKELARVEATLTTANDQIEDFLADLADVASTPDLPPAMTARLLSVTRRLANGLSKNIEPTVKDRIVRMLKEHGVVSTEKGSRRLATGNGPEDMVLFMKPYRTGVDPTRLEALLRAKQLKPAKYMFEIPTYKINPVGINKLLEDGLVTQDELDDCQYKESWTVSTPVTNNEWKEED